MPQVAARIVVAQAGWTPPAGYIAGSVDDLALGQLVTCTNLVDLGVTSWTWEVSPAVIHPLGVYGTAGVGAPALTLTPPNPGGYGDVSVKLTVRGDALPGGRPNVATDVVILGIRAPNAVYTRGIPIPHPHESQYGGKVVIDPTKGAQGRLAEIGAALAMGAGAGAVSAPSEWLYTLSGVYDSAVLGGFIDPPRYPPTARTLTSVVLARRTAGASGTTRVDVKKNGSSIFASAGAMPQVAAASGNNLKSAVTSFTTSSFATTDRIDVSLESVESYLAGPPEGPEGISVTLVWA